MRVSTPARLSSDDVDGDDDGDGGKERSEVKWPPT